MYMHLGEDILVKQKEIIAIIDIKTIKEDSASRTFFKNAEKKNMIQRIVEERKEKSLVITAEKYYLSPISAATLEKRSRQNLS